MKLQGISQDAHLIQLLPIYRYVLQMNTENTRRKFLKRGNIVHLLPDLMRGIVIESESAGWGSPRTCAARSPDWTQGSSLRAIRRR